MRKSIALCIAALLVSCTSTREAIPPGTIPEPSRVSAPERRYGDQVAQALMQQYPPVRDRRAMLRVRQIVDRLSRAAGSTDWEVYVLQGDDFANAAATQGNNIFVWTGMLHKVRGDDELATVIAHEMGHVLAKHVVPTPDEQVNEILTGLSGAAAQRGLTNSMGGAAGVVGSVVQQSLAGLLVNPESQRKELEADTIGLNIMSEAGYHPEAALRFWGRTAQGESDSRLQEFLSTHPTSQRRVEALEDQMPSALQRYDGDRGPRGTRS